MHIVYFSPTGGTRKAAYIIGKEIDPQATVIDFSDQTREQNGYDQNWWLFPCMEGEFLP